MLKPMTLVILLLASASAWGQDDDTMTDTEMAQLEQQLAEAQAQIERAAEQLRQTDVEALRAAERAREQAELAEERSLTDQERAELRAERQRVREQLREARREIQRANRDLARAQREVERERVHEIRMHARGNRGVIGLLLGEATDDGVVIVGTSPNGPAENAGIREQDILTGINGTRLAGTDDPMQSLREKMRSVEPGQTVSVTVMRDGEAMDFNLEAEQRRATAMAWVPDAPLPPDVDIDIDVEEIERMIRDVPLPEMPRAFAYRFEGEDGEIELHELSELGQHALADVNLWFGPNLTRGLSLTDLNPELGRYFGADNGVLVTEADDDNAWDLQAGDVITAVNGENVSSTRDLVRSIRGTDRGQEVRIQVLRDGSQREMSATVPERNTIGELHRQWQHRVPEPTAPPLPDQPAATPPAADAPLPARAVL